MYRYASKRCIIFYPPERVIEITKEDAFYPEAITAEEVDRVENDNVEIHGWSFVWLSVVTI
jgi:hypothetical protein